MNVLLDCQKTFVIKIVDHCENMSVINQLRIKFNDDSLPEQAGFVSASSKNLSLAQDLHSCVSHVRQPVPNTTLQSVSQMIRFCVMFWLH